MHCENTTFADHNKFKEYMKVEEAISEGIFDYFFDVRADKFLFKKRKEISSWIIWKIGPSAFSNRWRF